MSKHTPSAFMDAGEFDFLLNPSWGVATISAQPLGDNDLPVYIGHEWSDIDPATAELVECLEDALVFAAEAFNLMGRDCACGPRFNRWREAIAKARGSE